MAIRLLVVVACLWPTISLAQTTVKYVHTDALGSVVAMTDASGTVVEATREYEPYGQQLSPATQDGPGYTGHVQDAATGLTYMQQRYYDPHIGRFLSVDPITALSDPVSMFNRYRYGANNPYKFTDPDGRCFKPTGSNICGGGGFAGSRVASVASSVRSPLDTGTAGSQAGDSNVPPRPSQANLDKAVTDFRIDTRGAFGRYAPGLEGVDAQTLGAELFEVGRSSFRSRAYLGQSIGHEVIHVIQSLEGRAHFFGVGRNMNEAEAYAWNIRNAARFGSSQSELQGYVVQYHNFYDPLPQKYKERLDQIISEPRHYP